MGKIATVLLFAILAGSDNFQVGCAIGMLPIRRARKWALGALSGICEAGMSLAGLLAGSYLRVHVLGVASVARAIPLLLSGLLIIYFSLKDRDLAEIANSQWLFGLPFSLSLDNLVGGAGLGANGYPALGSAALIGSVCAVLSFGGLFLGKHVRTLLPKSAGALAGGWLALTAVRSLVH
jgi:manganese efflux pump family protein